MTTICAGTTCPVTMGGETSCPVKVGGEETAHCRVKVDGEETAHRLATVAGDLVLMALFGAVHVKPTLSQAELGNWASQSSTGEASERTATPASPRVAKAAAWSAQSCQVMYGS